MPANFCNSMATMSVPPVVYLLAHPTMPLTDADDDRTHDGRQQQVVRQIELSVEQQRRVKRLPRRPPSFG